MSALLVNSRDTIVFRFRSLHPSMALLVGSP